MLCALRASCADLDHLWVRWSKEEVPFWRAAALYFPEELWLELPEKWPQKAIKVGLRFLRPETKFGRTCYILCENKVNHALHANWDLKYVWLPLGVGEERNWYDASLLDVALICGQKACASLLARLGVEPGPSLLNRLGHDWFEWWELNTVVNSKLLVASTTDVLGALVAATRASLRRSFDQAGVHQGLAVYQMIRKLDPTANIPALVHGILDFSMETPKILQQIRQGPFPRGWLSYCQPFR